MDGVSIAAYHLTCQDASSPAQSYLWWSDAVHCHQGKPRRLLYVRGDQLGQLPIGSMIVLSDRRSRCFDTEGALGGSDATDHTVYVSKKLGGALCMRLCLSWREFETEGQVWPHVYMLC